MRRVCYQRPRVATNSPFRQAFQPFNITLACFALVLLIAIGVALHLSTLRPPNGAVVLGSAQVWRGHTACFRAAAVDGDGQPLRSASAISFALRDERGQRTETAAVAAPFAEVNLAVPRDLAVDAWLDVTVAHANGELEEIPLGVQAVDAPGPLRGVVAPWWSQISSRWISRLRQQPLQVALYPASGALVGGLSNRVLGRITQNGQPWAAHVEQSALQLSADADALGLFSFSWRPAPQAAPLKFMVGRAPALGTELPIESVPRQMQLRVHPAAVAAPNDIVEIHVDALPFRDAIQLDLWAGDLLIWGDSAAAERGQRDARMLLPTGYTGWILVTASRNPLAPQDTLSSALRWVGSEADGAAALIDRGGEEPLLGVLAAATPAARSVLLPAALSRFVPESGALPVLAHTAAARTAAFEAQQAASRAQVHTFMAAVVTLGLLIAGLYVLQHVRRVRRQVQQVVDDGMAAGEETLDPHLGRRVTRVENGAYLLLTLASLALASYGMITLLGKMRWH